MEKGGGSGKNGKTRQREFGQEEKNYTEEGEVGEK